MIVKKIKTNKRKEMIEITSLIKESVRHIKSGVVAVYAPHTTAGVAINEAYDPDVTYDVMDKFESLVPYSKSYRHAEGNADAHIQSVMVGSSVFLIIENNELVLGRWQGIFFMEFDGPRNREVYIKVMEG